MGVTTVRLMQSETVSSGQMKIDRISVGVGAIIHSLAKKTVVGAHILSPSSGKQAVDNPAKFANTAIPYLVELLKEKGIAPPYRVAIAGGATMPGSPLVIAMGPKVVQAVKDALKEAKLVISLDETGGSKVRSVLVDVETGKTEINTTPSNN